jgi:pimeloyl-ACP methyl ester carboxylesterase
MCPWRSPAAFITSESHPERVAPNAKFHYFRKSLFFSPGYDLTNQLPLIKCPTLIVHGDFDPIEPKYMKKVSCLIEGSDFWQLMDCGHFSYIERNEELFKLVEKFLAK